MNKEAIKKILPVLDAYSNNKPIQSNYGLGWKDIKTLPLTYIVDYLVKDCCKLRIKPEPEYVPFTFEDAEQLIGKSIKHKNNLGYSTIIAVFANSISIANTSMSFEDLFKTSLFLDGSPCGKLNIQ